MWGLAVPVIWSIDAPSSRSADRHLAQPGDDLPLAIRPPHLDADLVARLPSTDRAAQIGALPDRFPVYGRDDVTLPEAGAGGRGVLPDHDDDDAFPHRQAELRRERLVNVPVVHAEVGTADLTGGQDLVRDLARKV